MTTEAYAYDEFLNRLLSSVSASGESRTVAHSGNRDVDTAAGAVANAAYAMTYDATDRLASVSDGAVLLGAYLHNALGQRVSKTVGGIATTHYLHDLSGRLIAEADGATGVTAAEYIAFEGINLAFVTTGGIYWVHGDHLGSPQVLTDAARAVAWNALYSPFGLVEETGPLALAFNPRFPGQYHDRETGYYYNYFRTYDPTSGRYVESDPIGLRGGWNTYGYVGGNPVTRVDPFGLVFGIPGFLESFSGGISAAVPLFGGIGVAFGADVTARNCCGDDGVEYFEVVKTYVLGISGGISVKLSGARGQNIGVLSIGSSGLPSCATEDSLLDPSLTINVGPASALVQTSVDSTQVDFGAGLGVGASLTLNLIQWEEPITKVAIGCCTK